MSLKRASTLARSDGFCHYARLGRHSQIAGCGLARLCGEFINPILSFPACRRINLSSSLFPFSSLFFFLFTNSFKGMFIVGGRALSVSASSATCSETKWTELELLRVVFIMKTLA